MSREIPEDLIFEIISYLPLKLFVQCKSLSKNFNVQISDPSFQYIQKVRTKTNFEYLLYHSTLIPSSILSKLELQSYERSFYSSEPKLTPLSIRKSFTVLSSSGGLLLLQFHHLIPIDDDDNHGHTSAGSGRDLCVFNPITGAYRIIPSLLNFTDNEYNNCGFTSQFTDTNKSNFELVAVSLKWLGLKYYYTFYIFQFEGNNWNTSEKTLTLSNTDSSPEFVKGFQAVYHNDSFHWLRKDGDILVFNTKTQVFHIISRSIEFKLGHLKPYDTCFSVIQNKISIVMAERDKIFFYLYDFIHDSWKLDKILDKSRFMINDSSKVFPLFYDGKRLISETVTVTVTVTVTGIRDDTEKELYLDDVTTNLCREIPSLPFWCSSVKTFRYFSASLAKIPGCNYLSKQRILGDQDQNTVISILCCLHKFISCVGLSM